MTEADQYCAQLKEYRRILDLTKKADNLRELEDYRRMADAALIDNKISCVGEELLRLARNSMREVLRCQSLMKLYDLELKLASENEDNPVLFGTASFFFLELCQPTRVKMMRAVGFQEIRFGPLSVEVDK
jgi:hypothetical protein